MIFDKTEGRYLTGYFPLQTFIREMGERGFKFTKKKGLYSFRYKEKDLLTFTPIENDFQIEFTARGSDIDLIYLNDFLSNCTPFCVRRIERTWYLVKLNESNEEVYLR